MVVSHGGFIGVLTRTLLRSGKLKCADGVRPTKCGNTAVAMVEISADEGGSDGRWVLSKATLVGYGDVSHLDVVESLETNADELAIKD
jgi:probable phosphoglycerate mutase